jgi:hypothetical protein
VVRQARAHAGLLGDGRDAVAGLERERDMLRLPAGVPRGGPDALEQLRRLGWHAVGHRGLLAFPGDRLHRLSADLATGSAGVLLALGAVLGQGPAHLPFLGPPAARRGDGGRAGAAATKCER